MSPMVIIHEVRRWEVTESTTINSRSYMKAGSGIEEWYMCLGVVMEAEIQGGDDNTRVIVLLAIESRLCRTHCAAV